MNKHQTQINNDNIEKLTERLERLEQSFNDMGIRMAKMSEQVKYLCALCFCVGTAFGYLMKGVV